MLRNTILTPVGSDVVTPSIAARGACGSSLRDTRCCANCQVNIVSVHAVLRRTQQSEVRLHRTQLQNSQIISGIVEK